MAKQGSKPPASATGKWVVVRKAGDKRRFKVKFGSVTIVGTKPTSAAVKANVARSTAALERVGEAFSKPGVVLPYKQDVPQFSVAEGELGVFVRRLNGRTERGRLVDGSFRVID